MLVKRLLIVAAVVGTLAFSSRAFAQDESRDTTTTVAAAADSQDGPQKAKDTPPKPKSFVERLNNFGKTIFGGGLPLRRKPAKASATSDPSATSQEPGPAATGPIIVSVDDTGHSAVANYAANGRAGSILAKPKTPDKDDTPLSMAEPLPKVKPPAARPMLVETPKPASAELHERMESFRSPPFDSDEAGTADSAARCQPQQMPAETRAPSAPSVPILPSVPTEERQLQADSPRPQTPPILAQRDSLEAHLPGRGPRSQFTNWTTIGRTWPTPERCRPKSGPGRSAP